MIAQIILFKSEYVHNYSTNKKNKNIKKYKNLKKEQDFNKN